MADMGRSLEFILPFFFVFSTFLVCLFVYFIAQAPQFVKTKKLMKEG
jgi:hypothetical protein